jgi:hypothetical protein
MAKPTAAARKRLSKSSFVKKGPRKYPIPDAAHARDALASSSGKPEHAHVVAAVRFVPAERDIGAHYRTWKAWSDLEIKQDGRKATKKGDEERRRRKASPLKR